MCGIAGLWSLSDGLGTELKIRPYLCRLRSLDEDPTILVLCDQQFGLALAHGVYPLSIYLLRSPTNAKR